MILNKLRSLFDWFIIQIKDEYTISDYYRKRQGVKIGKKCRIIGKRKGLFGGEPYLVEVGNNVTIAGNVHFVTHDGGVGIFRDQYPGLNVFGRIHVCDNCFIGINSTLLPGVTIGSCSVVAAGSVVTRDVPPNTVVAGVPAHVIMSSDDYLEKVLRKGVYIHALDEQEKRKFLLNNFGSSGESVGK